LAREFEPYAATIAGWIRQAGVGDDGPTSLEREELARLQRKTVGFAWSATPSRRVVH